MPNSLVVPCCDCVPLLQSFESSLNWVPLFVRFPVPSPRILWFVSWRTFKPLLLGRPRENRASTGDRRLAVRSSAERNQQDSLLQAALNAGARPVSYPKKMRTRN